MMVNRILLIVMGLFLFSGVNLSAEVATAAPAEGVATQAQMDVYYANLRGELDKQNTKVQAMLQQAQSGQLIISDSFRTELEQAIIMLDVKKTLFTNFYDTESLKKSPAEREMLQKILSQDNISVSDLAELQALVKREKERLGLN